MFASAALSRSFATTIEFVAEMRSWLIFAAIAVSQFLLCTASAKSLVRQRDERFLALFNVIQFSNTPCNATMGNNQTTSTGVCYTSAECSNRGGRADGTCAAGFGVCCIFEYRACESQTSEPQDVVYFQNPGYPTGGTQPQICMFNVRVKDSSICQLRLDFLTFEMDPGSALSKPCDRDSFEILSMGSTAELGVGKLCGDNTGQHLYIPITNMQSRPTFRVMAEERTMNFSTPYMYNVKITQIDCNAGEAANALTGVERAPEGCRQYFTARRGTVTSLNWSPAARAIYNRDLDYSICFRRQEGDCQLTLKRSPGIPDRSTSVGRALTVTTPGACGNENGCGRECLGGVTGGQPPAPGAQFLADRLEIVALTRRNAPATPAPGNAREFFRAAFFCGVGLGSDATAGDGRDDEDGIIVQTKGPFVLRFVTDSFDSNPTTQPQPQPQTTTPAELGFSLRYSFQSSCSALNEVAPA